MLRLFRFLPLLLLFVACNRDLSYVGAPDPTPVVPEPLTANLTGTVLDENGQPMAGALVRVGNATATTNNIGYFRINNASLDKKQSLVKVERAGYFTGYRVFPATEATNQVVVRLIRKTLAGTVNAATGGEVNTANGGKISFQPNSVVVAASGAPFTGTMNVFASYIDPTSPEIAQNVPGSLMADNQNGQRVTLASYGMVAVELQSASGDKLQLKSGFPATLILPIPASLQASAPSVIAMWSVDENTGIWKEEGMGSRQGNNYVGAVRHFSFWNYDIGIPAIPLSMTLKNADGQPLVHALVRLTRAVNNYSSYGYTDTLGRVSGLVPANETLTMAVLGGACSNVIYSQTVGPFSAATNLGVITVSNPNPGLVTVRGRVLNCASAPLTNGYALVSLGYQVHFAATNANGEFSTNFTYCGQPGRVRVAGLDTLGMQQGPTDSFTLVTPVTNVGTITACGTSTIEFVNYTLDGVNYSLLPSVGDSVMGYQTPQGTQTPNTFALSAARMGTNQRFVMAASAGANTTGTFGFSFLNINQYNQISVSPNSQVVITTFAPSMNSFYEGSFNGSFVDSATTHTFSGTFRVRRTN